MFDDETTRYLNALKSRCREALGDQLVGLYLQGSGALGDYRAERSDLDVVAVVAGHLPDPLKDSLARRLDQASLRVPASGLDLLVVTRDGVRGPDRAPCHELWFSTGADWETEVDKQGRTSEHLLVFALCRERGQALWGPEPGEMFAPVPDDWLLPALRDVLAWHRTRILDDLHDPLGQCSILNACRAWCYAAERKLASKTEGAEWVLSREPGNRLAREALAIRKGRRFEPSDRLAIDDFLLRVIGICRDR